MTERKPANMGFESWIDQQINKARREGAFDHLEGKGKPLADLDRPLDPDWWVKKLIKRERLDAILPDTLSLKRDVNRFLEDVRTLPTEKHVRQTVEKLNERIAHINARPAMGPPSTVAVLNVENVVKRWRQERKVA